MAQLKKGDEILLVDGTETFTWQQVNMKMLSRLGETGEIKLTIARPGIDENLNIVLPINEWMANNIEPDPLTDLGIVSVQIPPIIGGVIEDGAADIGGLRAGDIVLRVNDINIESWSDWVEKIRSNPELEIEVVVQRDGVEDLLHLRPTANREAGGLIYGTIGAYAQGTSLNQLVSSEMVREITFNPISAIIPAIEEAWDKSLFVLSAIKKMVIGLISVKNINGPITIAQVAGETAAYGLEVYLGFLALLSISLGVLNLLPIPVLDGGQILFCIVEMITRRPVPEKVQAWGLQLGLLIISSIMVLAIYNDFNRFF